MGFPRFLKPCKNTAIAFAERGRSFAAMRMIERMARVCNLSFAVSAADSMILSYSVSSASSSSCCPSPCRNESRTPFGSTRHFARYRNSVLHQMNRPSARLASSLISPTERSMTRSFACARIYCLMSSDVFSASLMLYWTHCSFVKTWSIARSCRLVTKTLIHGARRESYRIHFASVS